MKARRVAIDTYRENVAYLHRDCPIYRTEGFQALTKVEIHKGGRGHRLLAVLNVVDDASIVAPDEIGLSESAFEQVTVRFRFAFGRHRSIRGGWELLSGNFYNRMIYGLFKPRVQILGADIAGTVGVVGPNVDDLKRGDAVYGDISHAGFGGFAEWVCAPAAVLARKPASLTFEQAAAVPQGAVAALHGLRDVGQLQPRHTVLVVGAGGCMGTFAVQLAKRIGADVTGVDSGRKLDTIHALGADHVIDYTREDFLAGGRRYDVILDLVGKRSVFAYKRALTARGTYVMVGAPPLRLLQLYIVGRWICSGETASRALGRSSTTTRTTACS